MRTRTKNGGTHSFCALMGAGHSPFSHGSEGQPRAALLPPPPLHAQAKSSPKAWSAQEATKLVSMARPYLLHD